MKKDFNDLRQKMDSSAIESAISSLQMIVSRPAPLFDAYAAMAALEEVVNITRDKKDDRSNRYAIVLRQTRPLISDPSLQQILIKLVASKEEAEIARVISQTGKDNASYNREWSYRPYRARGRTRRPYRGRGGRGDFSRGADRKCWICGRDGHISRYCSEKQS